MIKKIQINIKSTHRDVLFLYLYYIKTLLNGFLIEPSVLFLPTKKHNYVFLKSPHVFKKSKEHFIFKRHQISITFYSKNFRLIKQLLLNKPNTIVLKIFVV